MAITILGKHPTLELVLGERAAPHALRVSEDAAGEEEVGELASDVADAESLEDGGRLALEQMRAGAAAEAAQAFEVLVGDETRAHGAIVAEREV